MLAYKVTKDYKKIFDFILNNEKYTVLYCSSQKYGLIACFKKYNYKQENIKISFAPFNPSCYISGDFGNKSGKNSFINFCIKNDLNFIEPNI